MKLINCLIGLFMLSACGSPQTKNKNPEAIDFKTYFYPFKKLITPKVYVYEDTLTHKREYQEIRTLVGSPDTLLEVISYDSSFVKILYTRYKIGEMQLKIEEEIFYLPLDKYKSIAVPRVYERSAIDWLQSGNQDSITFTLLAKMSTPSLTINMANAGNFKVIDRSVSGLTYKPGDLLLQTNTETWNFDKTVEGVQQKVLRHATYWAKGIGIVGDNFTHSEQNMAQEHYVLINSLTLQGFKALAKRPLD